jgi:hypothetical protein
MRAGETRHDIGTRARNRFRFLVEGAGGPDHVQHLAEDHHVGVMRRRDTRPELGGALDRLEAAARARRAV